MTGLVTLYVVFGDADEAARIARQVIEEGLAACANILAPCHSFYVWEGKTEEAEEVPALFKTTHAASRRLADRISSLHSYEVPAITVWDIVHAPNSYGKWIAENTR